MRLQIRRQLLFIQCQTATTLIWSMIKRGLLGLQRYSLYHTCDTLPLDRFIRCLCQGDLTALTITGRVPKNILAVTWDRIYMEYVELDGATNTVYLNHLRRDLMLLGSKIDRVYTIVRALDILFDKRLVAELNDLGLPFKYDHLDQVRYRKDLMSSINYVAPWKLEYTQLEKELNAIVTENESGVKVDRSYFDRVLARLSKYYGYQVQARKISVTEFVIMLKEYMDYLETQKRHGKQG